MPEPRSRAVTPSVRSVQRTLAEDTPEERPIVTIAIVSAKPSMELADTYGLRERRIVQMAAGASLIEATLDCYSLETMEASDSSLREGAIIAWAQAGSNWRDQISALVSGS